MQMRVYNKVQTTENIETTSACSHLNQTLWTEEIKMHRLMEEKRVEKVSDWTLTCDCLWGKLENPENPTHTRRTWKLQQKGPEQNPGPLRVPTPWNLSFGGDWKSTFTKGFQWFLMFFIDHSLKNEHTYFWVKPFSDGLGQAERVGGRSSCEEKPKSSLRVLLEEHMLRWKPSWPSVEPHLHSRCAVHQLRHCRRCLVLFIMEMDPTIDFC